MNAGDDIVNDNQRRAIGITLGLLDEVLCRIEQWGLGHHARGVLYKERNNLTPAQRRFLLEEVARLRSTLKELADRLTLPRQSRSATDDIRGQCAAFRDRLLELEGGRLRGYGQVHPELEDLLDKSIPPLLEGVGRIARCVTRTRASDESGGCNPD